MITANLKLIAGQDPFSGIKTFTAMGTFFNLSMQGAQPNRDVSSYFPFWTVPQMQHIGRTDANGNFSYDGIAPAPLTLPLGPINIAERESILGVYGSYTLMTDNPTPPPVLPKGVANLVSQSMAGTLPPLVFTGFQYVYQFPGTPAGQLMSSDGFGENVGKELAQAIADALGVTLSYALPDYIQQSMIVSGNPVIPFVTMGKTVKVGALAYLLINNHVPASLTEVLNSELGL